MARTTEVIFNDLWDAMYPHPQRRTSPSHPEVRTLMEELAISLGRKDLPHTRFVGCEGKMTP